MPFLYSCSPVDFPLKQGELLSDLLEFPIQLDNNNEWLEREDKPPFVIRRQHPLVIVISQGCDLDGDWRFRSNPSEVKKDEKDERKLLESILFCDVFEYDEIRWSRGFNSTLWERIPSNQDERYHFFKESIISGTDISLPELYVDFKRIFTLPANCVYTLISAKVTNRVALIPDLYMQDFMHRQYNYLSRVAVT